MYLKTKQDRENVRKAWINGRQTIKYKNIEYIASETTKGGRVVYSLVLWRGSEARPRVNCYYYSQKQRDENVEYYKKLADQHEQYDLERKQPKPELVHNLKKGDLFYTSWGYDQTNYDYIVILEIKGKHAICQRTSALHMGTSGTSNVQEPIFCPFGDTFKMKIQGSNYSGSNSISLRGSYPFLHTGIINNSYGGKNVRLDTFFQVSKGQQFHETMIEFGH